MKKALLIVSVAVFGLSFGGGEQAVSTFTDSRDGQVYRIVQIGSQVWFAENLNYAAKGSKCYDNKAANCAKYGRLYDWKSALTACPAGFHLPTYNEWTTLVDYVGGEKMAGKKLKSKTGWNNNGNGTDNYGFSALPGGYGESGGRFSNAGIYGYWWSATVYVVDDVWSLGIYYDYEHVYMFNGTEEGSFSVRCVQNKEGEQ